MEIVLASNNKHKVTELEYFINKMCAEKGVETDVVAETKALVAQYLGNTGEGSDGKTTVSRAGGTSLIGGTSSIGVQEPAVVRNARRETAEASSPV